MMCQLLPGLVDPGRTVQIPPTGLLGANDELIYIIGVTHCDSIIFVTSDETQRERVSPCGLGSRGTIAKVDFAPMKLPLIRQG